MAIRKAKCLKRGKHNKCLKRAGSARSKKGRCVKRAKTGRRRCLKRAR